MSARDLVREAIDRNMDVPEHTSSDEDFENLDAATDAVLATLSGSYGRVEVLRWLADVLGPEGFARAAVAAGVLAPLTGAPAFKLHQSLGTPMYRVVDDRPTVEVHGRA